MARKLLRLACVATLLGCAAYGDDVVCWDYNCQYCDGVACAGQSCVDYTTGNSTLTCFNALSCIAQCQLLIQ